MIRASVVLTMAVFVVACVDSGERFDDFEDNVIDATPVEIFDAAPLDFLPDITGTFYFAMFSPVAPDAPFQFRGEFDLTQRPDGTGTIGLILVPLTTADRVPIGDPITSTGDEVSAAGQFTVPFNIIVLGDANPLSSNDLTIDGALNMTIRDENAVCGAADPAWVTAPITLEVGPAVLIGLRTSAGATGDDLPAATSECPNATPPDAGPTDAGTPDAGTPDAA